MLHRLGTAVLGLALACAVLVLPAGTSAQAAPAGSSGGAQKYASAAFKATNQARTKRDLGKLQQHPCLRKAAAMQAKKMAKKREIFHQELGPVLERCGLSTVGENVAYGYATGTTVVRKGWMKSPGHRRNILDQQFTAMGIAARKAGGQWYVAQVLGRPVS